MRYVSLNELDFKVGGEINDLHYRPQSLRNYLRWHITDENKDTVN
jgi:hypothetical protein